MARGRLFFIVLNRPVSGCKRTWAMSLARQPELERLIGLVTAYATTPMVARLLGVQGDTPAFHFEHQGELIASEREVDSASMSGNKFRGTMLVSLVARTENPDKPQQGGVIIRFTPVSDALFSS